MLKVPVTPSKSLVASSAAFTDSPSIFSARSIASTTNLARSYPRALKASGSLLYFSLKLSIKSDTTALVSADE